MTNLENQFARVLHRLDPRSTLLRARKLEGGISAQVTALEIARADGQRQKLLIRQHGEGDLKYNPRIAADEFKLLRVLQAEGLPAPVPYTFDQSGEILATPYIIIEYIEGQTEFTPANLPDFIAQFTEHLARIHRLDGTRLDLSFLPQQEKRAAERLRERQADPEKSSDEKNICEIVADAWPPVQRNPAALLHGDFWPGNLLWRAGQLVAVIDWEDALLGDPLADLANSRLEMLWAFDEDAMEQFTRQYQALATLDYSHLPYWDLYAALRLASLLTSWTGDELAAETMRAKYRRFIAQACERLAALGSR